MTISIKANLILGKEFPINVISSEPPLGYVSYMILMSMSNPYIEEIVTPRLVLH